MSVQPLDHSKNAYLPQPRPPLDPAAEPFVGNETVDDNLAESALIVLWGLTMGRRYPVDLSVADGVVTLQGAVDCAAQRLAIGAAIGRIAGVRAVVNSLEVASAKPSAQDPLLPTSASPLQAVEPRPFLYLVRYCGLTEASLSAAIREAIGKLDAFFTSQGLALPNTLFVLYRNQYADMVTIEIGMPLEAQVVPYGEFRLGSTPGGPMMTARVEAGPESLKENSAALVSRALAAGLSPADYFWQRFEEDAAFRPWGGHPVAEVFLPVTVSR